METTEKMAFLVRMLALRSATVRFDMGAMLFTQ